MTRHKQIVIHAEQTEDFSFTISAQAEDGHPVPLNEMKRQTFPMARIVFLRNIFRRCKLYWHTCLPAKPLDDRRTARKKFV